MKLEGAGAICYSTLSCLGLWNPLSDDPTGVVHGCGWFKLHGLHHVALADADLERQGHHLGGWYTDLTSLQHTPVINTMEQQWIEHQVPDRITYQVCVQQWRKRQYYNKLCSKYYMGKGTKVIA